MCIQNEKNPKARVEKFKKYFENLVNEDEEEQVSVLGLRSHKPFESFLRWVIRTNSRFEQVMSISSFWGTLQNPRMSASTREYLVGVSFLLLCARRRGGGQIRNQQFPLL